VLSEKEYILGEYRKSIGLLTGSLKSNFAIQREPTSKVMLIDQGEETDSWKRRFYRAVHLKYKT
jgi:hypothetical protein